MCLGGGSKSYPTGGYEYKAPVIQNWTSPYLGNTPDTVNNKIISDSGDYSQEATKDIGPKKAALKSNFKGTKPGTNIGIPYKRGDT